jgi:ribose transport system permease protein
MAVKADMDPGVGRQGRLSKDDWQRRLGEGVRGTWIGAVRGENPGMLMLVVVITIGIFAVILRSTSFLSLNNFESITEQSTTIIVMAVAMVMVLSVGEIDISFASIIPVSAYTAAILIGRGIPFAVVAALLVGVVVGLINGFVTVKLAIPSFVVTLGTMGVLNGVAAGMKGGATLTMSNQTFLDIFGEGSVGPIPVLLIWAAVAVVGGSLFLNRTAVGRHLLATGANPAAARYSGIRTSRLKIGALVGTGVAGSLAGLLYLGEYTAATYTLGSADLLTVIAAVIIGGTALQGGRGSVVGALVGAMLLGLLNNALVVIGFSAPTVLVAQGAIIVFAVILSSRGKARGQ